MICQRKCNFPWIGALLIINITAQTAGVSDSEETTTITGTTSPTVNYRITGYPGCGKPETTPNNQNAGLTAREKRWGLIEPVIVGGIKAKANAWPWMVGILELGDFTCGGSLISKKYVLTAAHCINARKEDLNLSDYSILVGSNNIDEEKAYAVESILVHPNYSSGQNYNDICILGVIGLVQLGVSVGPVCLPCEGMASTVEREGRKVTVIGYGTRKYKERKTSKYLYQVTIHITSLKECNESYYKIDSTTFSKGVTNQMICAGEEEGGKDSCQGDSGGPMVTNMPGGGQVQIGIVSLGYKCAEPRFPGVYTRVSPYMKFISENTDIEPC